MKSDHEKRRALLRFQCGIFDFENGCHEILADSEFVDQLIDYIFRLSLHGHKEVALRILKKLDDYRCGDQSRYGEQSLHILSAFIERVNKSTETRATEH